VVFRTPSIMSDSLNDLKNLSIELQNFAKNTPVLIVTGPNIIRSGALQRVKDILNIVGVDFVVYEKPSGEPDDREVAKGTSYISKYNCGCVIGLGGGSQLDTAKAIAVTAVHGGDVLDYKGVGLVPGPVLSLITVATTAGSGSEVTPYTVITISATGEKILIVSPFLVPDISVSDATLMGTVPGTLIASTGVDALCHALESFVSLRGTELSRSVAADAMQGIVRALPKVYLNSGDQSSYRLLARSAALAGLAIGNSSVTLLHGMSRPFGAMFNIGHGLSNALLLPVWVAYTFSAVPQKMEKIANLFGVSGKHLVEAILGFFRTLNIPSFRDFVPNRIVLEQKVSVMAQQALASGSPGNNPRSVNEDQIKALYLQAWDESAK